MALPKTIKTGSKRWLHRGVAIEVEHLSILCLIEQPQVLVLHLGSV